MTDKRKTAILVLSLSVNVAVLGFIAFRTQTVHGPGSEGEHESVPARQTNLAKQSLVWGTLSSGGMKSQIAQLKSAGFPPEIVQGIIRAELDQFYNARRKELIARYPQRAYWQASYARFNFTGILGLNIIQEEENGQMRALFGADFDNTAYDTGRFMPPVFNVSKQSDGLPPEKFQKIAAIMSDYNAMRADLYVSANDLVYPDSNSKGDFLNKQQEADIEAALTPDELLEYNMRTSTEANSLRWSLEAFNPSENEFRAIFKVQDDFNRRFSTGAGLASADVQKERDAHKAELDAQLQQALGADRFAQYKVDSQPDYSVTSKVVNALSLPSGSVQRVLDVENDVTKRVNSIRNDPTLSDADRAVQLAALSGEARTRLSAVLGDKGLELYRANAGFWLTSLPQGK